MVIKSIMFIGMILTSYWIVRLLEDSRQASHNDNEILSIIEELHEIDFIINWNGIHNYFSWHRNDEQCLRKISNVCDILRIIQQ